MRYTLAAFPFCTCRVLEAQTSAKQVIKRLLPLATVFVLFTPSLMPALTAAPYDIVGGDGAHFNIDKCIEFPSGTVITEHDTVNTITCIKKVIYIQTEWLLSLKHNALTWLLVIIHLGDILRRQVKYRDC